MPRPAAAALALWLLIGSAAFADARAIIQGGDVPVERVTAPESASSRPGVLGWIVVGTVGAMWLAGVVMAGTMFGQAVSLRSGANLAFGTLAVAIFAGLPISFLPRTAFVLVPIALAGGAWGYRRRPLSGSRSRGSSGGATGSR